MGGSSEQETVTESSPWQPSQTHITSGMDWAKAIVEQMSGNVPMMGQLGLNSNLVGAWDKLSGPELNQMAGWLGNQGAGMMSGLSQLPDLYEQIGKGPNLYNQQSTRDTLLADQQAYLDAQNSAMMKNLNTATAQATGQIYGAAAGQGNVGSSRTQLATGQAAGDLSSNAHLQMTNLTNQAYNTAMNQAMNQETARLAALQAQATGIAGLGQMGAGLVSQAGNVYQQQMNNMLQAGMGQLSFEQQNALIQYQNEMNAWTAPQNLVGWYSGIAQGAGGLGGTSTSTSTGGGGMSGIIGGMAGSFAGGMGGSAGEIAGNQLFSDKRLKKDIEKIGYNGRFKLNVYKWTWNEIAEKELGLCGESTGYIAQEVCEVHPSAVMTDKDSGWLKINYSKLPWRIH